LFDEYEAIKYNNEKARLDNFAIALQNDPNIKGYIIAYRGDTEGFDIGTRKLEVIGDICAQYRLDRAIDYLVSERGISRGRLIPVDGGNRRLTTVQLWLCPENREAKAKPDETISRPGPSCVTQGTPVRRPTHQRKPKRKKRH
jgi:hypothetical protein